MDEAMNTQQTTPFSTVRDLLRYAVTRFTREKLFFGHGSENAFDEAAYLILHTLSLPIDRLEPFLDARLLPEEIASVMDSAVGFPERSADVRLAQYETGSRKPKAYLTAALAQVLDVSPQALDVPEIGRAHV